jgi:pro-sigmaK processing inhibitor BofA
MKWIIKIIKQLIFAIAILSGFNMIMNSLNIFIPINVYTILAVATLGFPGLFLLVGLIAFI